MLFRITNFLTNKSNKGALKLFREYTCYKNWKNISQLFFPVSMQIFFGYSSVYEGKPEISYSCKRRTIFFVLAIKGRKRKLFFVQPFLFLRKFHRKKKWDDSKLCFTQFLQAVSMQDYSRTGKSKSTQNKPYVSSFSLYFHFIL